MNNRYLAVIWDNKHRNFTFYHLEEPPQKDEITTGGTALSHAWQRYQTDTGASGEDMDIHVHKIPDSAIAPVCFLHFESEDAADWLQSDGNTMQHYFQQMRAGKSIDDAHTHHFTPSLSAIIEICACGANRQAVRS